MLNTSLSLSSFLVEAISCSISQFLLIYFCIISNISFLKPPSKKASLLILPIGSKQSIKTKGSSHSSNSFIKFLIINLSILDY